MAGNNVIIVRETFGTYALDGPKGKFQTFNKFKKDDEEARFAIFSPNRNVFAVGNSSSVTIHDTQTGSQTAVISKRMLQAQFSPNGSYLIGWDNPSQNTDNYKIWSVSGKTSSPVHALKLSKFPEIQFSGDEKLYARLTNNAILFSEVPEFSKTAFKSPDDLKITSFSLSTGAGPVHVLCYIPSNTGPSFARLYRYPNFETTIASKSFFQADRVEMKWNQKGTAVLLITSTDVDKTGKSYYGKTMLHYLDTKGSTATVQTAGDDPVIHDAQWSPNSIEFCVIMGKMPQTRAALFNSKCDSIFDMGISARNAIHFNPQGNLVLLGGFGNLAHGVIEIWDVKKLKKKVAQMQAPTTTQLQWLNDGVHFATGTTAPRMQTDNSFKVWHFSGKLVFEWKAQKFLYGFYPFTSTPPPPFPEEELDAVDKLLGNKQIPPREETKKAAAYVPVHLRKGGAGALQPKNQSKESSSPALSENEKKIKTAKKKLDQIKKLKEQLAEGKNLEKNQLEKISTEASLLEEIASLEIA